MFNFAVSRDILETTPCPGVSIDEIAAIKSRERVLREPSDNNGVDEILTFWTELEKASMSDEVKRILKLILVTGQRPGEVVGIHSDEITVEEWEGVEGAWWTIPVSRRKVKEKAKIKPQPHRVFLSKMALELLGDFKGYAFLSPKSQPPKEGRKSRKQDPDAVLVPAHIDENAIAYAIRRNLKDYKARRPIKGDVVKMVKVKESRKMDIDHFTPHDLRRTCSTRLSELGFKDEINDAILGHAKKGVIGIYNKYGYAREKILAAEAWERKLNGIITGEKSNVISIEQGRKKAA
jgi:integrase